MRLNHPCCATNVLLEFAVTQAVFNWNTTFTEIQNRIDNYSKYPVRNFPFSIPLPYRWLPSLHLATSIGGAGFSCF
jgi:hypothetical protein